MTALFDFVGADTGRGYEQFLRELRPSGEEARVCLVRGALGAGRHLLLEALAEEWERQGRPVRRHGGAGGEERLLAVTSGPWAALDGALLPEPEDSPCDLRLDLSETLDRNALRDSRAQAGALYRDMQRLRSRAWRCLQVAHTAWSDSAAIYAEAVEGGALMNLRMELTRWMHGEPGGQRNAFLQAVTPDGLTGDGNCLTGKRLLRLELPWGFDADSLLYPVAAALRQRGEGFTACMQPLDGSRLAHLYTGTHALTTFDLPAEANPSLRFDEAVLRREQSALAFNRAAHDLWIRQAREALTAARERRRSLERIIGDAVIPERRAEMLAQAMAFFA